MTASAPRNHPAEDAHPAPTPAPVAVPEGGWRDGDWFVTVRRNVYALKSDGRWHVQGDDFMPGFSYSSVSFDDWASEGQVVYVHAPREEHRPEPVVAPLPSEAVERLRVAMLGTTDGDFIDPESEVPAGEMFRLAAEWLTNANLVPEDDEDTVRRCLHDPGTGEPRGDCPCDPEGCGGGCPCVDEDTVRVPLSLPEALEALDSATDAYRDALDREWGRA